MSGFPAPSDGSIPNSIINGVDQIRLTQWHFDMYGTRYLEEITRGVAYGTQDSRFSSSGLLNITLANVESYAQQHIQCLQTLIANKNLLVASGTANTITLSTRVIDDSLESGIYAKNAPLPLNFRDGLELDFVAIADNTGAVTISIPSFQGINGALNLVKQDFSALTSGDIKASYRYTIICDSTNNRFILKDAFVRQATETITGTVYLNKPIALTYSSTTTLLYSAGTFQFDDGTGQGVVTSGSAVITSFYPTPTNNTAYYLFAVKNLTTNATTVIISSSKTSPTLPSGFTKKAYIGSLMTNGSGQIRSGKWFDGNKRFEYASRSFDHTIITPIATRTPYALMAPPLTHAIFNASIDDSDDTNTDVIFTSYWQDDLAPTQTNGLSDFANGGLRANSIELTRELNTSRQIYVRTDVVANSTLYLTTLGWLELF